MPSRIIRNPAKPGDDFKAQQKLEFDRYRTAIEMRLIQELSREECAKQLAITVGTFDVLLFRAVRAFRKQFGSRDSEGTGAGESDGE